MLFVVLPLSRAVVFPGESLTYRQPLSPLTQALDEAYAVGRPVLLLHTCDFSDPPPSWRPEHLHRHGVLADITAVARDADGTLVLSVRAQDRAEATRFVARPGWHAEVRRATPGPAPRPERLAELRDAALKQSQCGAKAALPPLLVQRVLSAPDASAAVDLLGQHEAWPVPERFALLAADLDDRLTLATDLLHRDLQASQLDRVVAQRVRAQQAEQQREHHLREQLRAITEELHGDESGEVDALAERLQALPLPPAVRAEVDRELRRLRHTPPTNPEYGLTRTYLDWCAALPWGPAAPGAFDLQRAEATLNQEHFGLEAVKERILDFLAASQLAQAQGFSGGTSLCLVGPPGVGKTSIARSVASALGRKFVRIALGGMRDEAEIRGHRRTYVGAMPGRLLQAIRSVGVRNPLILLDEIDKVAGDAKGAIDSALLEVLDPNQNQAFADHYLAAEYDLSGVLFITTANALGPLSKPLLDRLEIVPLAGYTPAEKQAIAQQHVLPKLLRVHGLEALLRVNPDALEHIIRNYTQEPGVRNLERQIVQLLRKHARTYLHQPWTGVRTVTANDVMRHLGLAPFVAEPTGAPPRTGVAHSLAWSTLGGCVLSIETAVRRGSGELRCTGSLGSVLQEAVSAAVAHVRTFAADYGHASDPLADQTLHLHVPDTATPKDGASVGLAAVASVLSTLRGVPLPHDLAMTGEVTLLGRVLPVAGVREKLLAAQSAGFRRVMLPADNLRDVGGMESSQIGPLELVYVAELRDALPHLFGPDQTVLRLASASAVHP